jgi:hypothetical protein
MVSRATAIAVLATALALAAAARPAEAFCRLALLLALDVSSSVDAEEYALQRDGLAAALMAPEVQAALLADPESWVEIAAYEWSGRRQQHPVLDWTAIRAAPDIAAAAGAIAGAERSFVNFPTAMGYALGFGAVALDRRGQGCDRQVIDVSGDGINNEGFRPPLAYKHFPFDGVTVNGLVIDSGDARVITFYHREVIRGPGAFVEVADGYGDFARAMRRKLLREIGNLAVGALAPAPGR